MANKIEEIIDEIEQFIEKSKRAPFSPTNIVVNKEEIEELLRELRMKTPDEIKRYQKMLNNRDAILDDAQERAIAMLEEANESKMELISEHQIMQQAYAQANQVILEAQSDAEHIILQAEKEANALKESSVAYVGDSLGNLQNLIANTMDHVDAKVRNMMETMDKYYGIVTENRNELLSIEEEEKTDTAQQEIHIPETNPEDELRIDMEEMDY